MKKNIFFFFSLLCLSAHGTNFDELLKKSKITGPIKGAYSTDKAFQINLKENKTELTAQQVPPMQLLTLVPAIGKYGTPYKLTTQSVLIELNPCFITQALPEQLKQSLIALYSKKTLQEILCRETTYAHIMFSNFFNQSSPYNLVFHPFGSLHYGTNFFNINMNMGAFSPHGIKCNDIVCNELKAMNVNYHPPYDYSPSNALITLSPGRDFVTFWTVASYEKYLTITYHLMINNEIIQNIFNTVTQNAKNIGELLAGIKTIQKSLSNKEDQSALTGAIQTIEDILHGEEYQTRSELSSSLNQLNIQLQTLQKQLKT